MFKHHQETIEIVSKKLMQQQNILALMVGGSIAHGFAGPNSDLDIFLIVSEEEYTARFKEGNLCYWENESCTYQEGYIDGKYISKRFMEKVARQGSEPARFAFKDTLTVFSRIGRLDELINQITRYPVEQKDEKIAKFYAQVEAWRWFSQEALKHQNLYLLNYAVPNLILFGGRLILAYNETLYPYHKWFLRVLERVDRKPQKMMELIDRMLQEKSLECIEEFYQSIIQFNDWGFSGLNWGNRFMLDSELSWMHDHIPVSDL